LPIEGEGEEQKLDEQEGEGEMISPEIAEDAEPPEGTGVTLH